MKVSVVYLYIAAPADNYNPPPPSFYEEYSVRFAWTYGRIDRGYPHEFVVVSCGAPPDKTCHTLFDPFRPRYLTYTGGGWDLGAYQWAAHQLDSEFMMNLATPIKLTLDGWLARLVEARKQFGDGMYAPQASCQYRPHLRTGSYGCSPELLRRYPWPINDRQDAVFFECGGIDQGDKCFTNWVSSQGLPTVCVAKDGCYPKEQWPQIKNGFRRGDQSNLILWDRHNTIYRDAVPAEKARQELEAWPA